MNAIIEVKNIRQFQQVIESMSEATGIDVPIRDAMSYRRQIDDAFALIECILNPDPLINVATNEPFTEEELIKAVSKEIMTVFKKHVKRFARKLPKGHVIYVAKCHLIVTDELRDDNYGGDLLAKAGRSGGK